MLEVEGWSVQVRSRLSEELILFGLELSQIEPHRFRHCIHVDQLLALHPAKMPTDRRSGAADDFPDASVG